MFTRIDSAYMIEKVRWMYTHPSEPPSCHISFGEAHSSGFPITPWSFPPLYHLFRYEILSHKRDDTMGTDEHFGFVRQSVCETQHYMASVHLKQFLSCQFLSTQLMSFSRIRKQKNNKKNTKQNIPTELHCDDI